MTRFIVSRLALFCAAFVILSMIIFAALRILPGDVASVMAGTDVTPERVAALRAELGLNKPLLTQYGEWMSSFITGHFGTSMMTGQSVGSLVGLRASVTFPLIILGLLVAIAIGLPLGCASVLSKRHWVRSVCEVIAIIGGAVPALWLGMLLILLLSRGNGVFGIFPSQGFAQLGWSQPLDAFMALMLPALTVGIIVGASIMRYTRAALMQIADSDVIAMARANGMTRNHAIMSIGMRLALPQLVSVIGLAFAEMITGVMVIENLFALPGIGNGLVNDLGHRDLIAVQSELMLLTGFFLAIGLIVDIAHRMLDPRLAVAGFGGAHHE